MTDATPPAPAPEPSKPQPAPAPAPSTPQPAPAIPVPLVLLVVAIALAVAIGVRASRGGGGGTVEQLLAKAGEIASDPAQGLPRALPTLLDAYEKAPEDPRTNLALGRALWELGRPDEALAPLQKAHDLLKGEQGTDLLLGRCLGGLGKVAEARPLFEGALKRRPDDPTPLRDLAVIAFTEGDLPRSKELLDDYLARAVDPRAIELYRLLVHQLGRPLDLIGPLQKLAQLTPGNVRLRRELQGMLLERDGHAKLRDDALAALKETDPPPATGAAAAPAATDRPPEPSAADQKALVRSVDLYLAGRILSYDHRTLKDALAAFERAAALDPVSPWARLGLAVTHVKLGDAAKGRQGLEELLKGDPNFGEARFQLAKLDAIEGKLDAATAAFDGLLRPNEPLARVSAEWAVACRLAGPDPEKGLAHARTFIPAGAPPGDAARGLEARALRRLGRFDEALKVVEAIRDAAKAPADRVDALEHLGHLLLDAGREADAVKAFDEALAAIPAGVTPAADLLLWAGVARARSDAAGAKALWERGAAGAEYHPVAQATWSCRRLLGQPVEADLIACARSSEPVSSNDAWYVEGLARSLGGDAEGAKKAWEQARATTFARDYPHTLIERALE